MYTSQLGQMYWYGPVFVPLWELLSDLDDRFGKRFGDMLYL